MSKTGEFFADDRAALRTAVEYIMGTGVHGDVVEFGCYRGRTALILAGALRDFADHYGFSERVHGVTPRKLWVFDSFQGFPEASNEIDKSSPHIKAGVWYAGQPAGGSPAEVAKLCAAVIGATRVQVVPGWYKDTLSQIPEGTTFGLVHVDCDYYESTFQVLDHVLGQQMLADGATILFDDWYCNRGSPDFGEQKAWSDACDKYAPRYTDWGPYGAVGRRFIVHGAA